MTVNNKQGPENNAPVKSDFLNTNRKPLFENKNTKTPTGKKKNNQPDLKINHVLGLMSTLSEFPQRGFRDACGGHDRISKGKLKRNLATNG